MESWTSVVFYFGSSTWQWVKIFKFTFEHRGLRIPLLWGEVVNSAFEIGIGLKFVELSPAQKEFLEKLVTIVQKSIGRLLPVEHKCWNF